MKNTSIVGIDLGTTNSGVSVVKNGAPEMLLNGEERIIPSVVGYSSDHKWLVGTPARNQYILAPENTVQSIKRQMGTDARVTLAGKEFTPQEISSFILRELKEIAERNLGHEVTDAVITVPAYFSDAARQATQDAGRIAGFNVRRIINEPTAAALAYGLNQIEDIMVLVYDLGGGTFDASLVELMEGVVDVRASHGNTQLGGDDFDRLLAEHLADHFQEEHQVDLRQDRRAWARLIRAAEAAKIELSSHPFAWVKEEYLVEKNNVPLHLEVEIDRQTFEGLIFDLLTQTLESIDQVLADAQVTAEEIDQVLLVGGSTRVPLVRELIEHHLDIEPQVLINPEEAVALGAGVQAAIIEGKPIDAILVDVTPHSLGIAVAETRLGRMVTDRYKRLIHRNTTIPVTEEEVFYTLFPDQDTVKIEVYQGESLTASKNTLLGDFLITDLKPKNPGDLAAVTVQFDLDVNGMLTVTARDRETGHAENITVEASPMRLSEKELLEAKQRMSQTAADTSTEDVFAKRAEALLETGDLTAEQQDQVRTLLADIQAAETSGDASRREELQDTLLELLFDLED